MVETSLSKRAVWVIHHPVPPGGNDCHKGSRDAFLKRPDCRQCSQRATDPKSPSRKILSTLTITRAEQSMCQGT